jgi:hypothetical protein
MGYSFIPHGINVAIIGRLLNIPTCIHIIGGTSSIEGRRFTCGFLKRVKISNSIIKKVFLKILNSSKFITVTGSATKDILVSKGIDADKIIVLSSTIDTKRFFPVGSEKRYDLITVADLIETKRIDLFLEIVSILVRKGLNIKAVVLGEGALRTHLEGLTKRLGLEGVVHFAGYRPDVERYLCSSRIFLLPTNSEGLSLAMLEAMACGAVPIVSRVGDMGDAVKDGVNGRLVNRNDTDGFVSAVAILLRNPAVLEEYSKLAIDTVQEKYTVENASKKWKEIFCNLREERGLLMWCLNRLQAMHALEIWYRATCYLRKTFLYLNFLRMDKNGHLSSGHLRREVLFFIDKKDIDFIRGNFIDAEYGKVFSFSRINSFEKDVYGAGAKYLKNDIKRRAGFCKTEIRKIWELNRFQWLVNYAQSYAIERDEGVVERTMYILTEWIKRNPVLEGINWSDSLESALRLLSWTWIYFLIKDSKNFDRDFENIFLRSVYFQARFIEANLSKFSSANNHLIGEAVGLFIVGLLFPQLRGVERMMNKGKIILERELGKQVYPDGVSKEQSIKYHEFVIDLYLLAIIIGEKNGISFHKDTYLRLEKMCEFLLHISDEEGLTPSIGDSDDGYALKLNITDETANTLSILNIASVIFKRPDFRKKDVIDGKSLWLLGRDGYAKYFSSKAEKAMPVSRDFPDGGYYIMRHKDLFLTFDCGSLGYNSLAAHGHSDALSFTLDIGGRHILVDPGTYLYSSGDKWRDYFRSTKAHNTIEIDHMDQSEMKGPFLWGYKARSFIKYWSPNGGYDKVLGYHTGYTRLKDPVVHEREIMLDKSKEGIFIKDLLHSKRRHLVALYFHLHPDCTLRKVGNNLFEIRNSNICVFLDIDKQLEANVFRGSEGPICGWYSERFGVKVETWTIQAEGHFEGDAQFLTEILAGYKNEEDKDY